MKVVVGSLNPTKVDSVRAATKILWPERQIEVLGREAKSGVAEQPMSESETIAGARSRALQILEETDCDFAVGIEGGQYKLDNAIYLSDWAIVIDRSRREGIGGTPRYLIPEHINRHISPERDLSRVLHEEFDLADVGKKHGYAGMITGNHITRTTSNRDAVVIAFAPFVRNFFRD